MLTSHISAWILSKVFFSINSLLGFIGDYAIISLTEFYHKTCHTSFHLALLGLDQRSSPFFFFLPRLSNTLGVVSHTDFAIVLLCYFGTKATLYNIQISRSGFVPVEQAWGLVCSVAHSLWITVPCHSLLSPS